MPAIKLQKLVYYCQAWSLVWDEEPLFNEKIEAWVHGPVIPELYKRHSGKYYVTGKMLSNMGASIRNISRIQTESIDAVLEHYGDKSPKWLSDLTHLEDPWKNARKGLSPRDRGSREISHASLAEYYSSIMEDD